VPGEPLDVPLLWDGWRMAQSGRPAEALGWTLFAAFFAGILTVVCMVAMAVPFAKFALKFDAPDYFAIIVFGLTSVVALGGASLTNAFISLFVGLFIATIGVEETFGAERFSFGIPLLADGVEYLTVMVGAYGVGEVLVRFEQGFKTTPMAMGAKVQTKLPSLVEAFRLRATFLRSSVIGLLAGIVPAPGRPSPPSSRMASSASTAPTGRRWAPAWRRASSRRRSPRPLLGRRPHGAAAGAGHPGQRRHGGDPRRLPAARHAAGPQVFVTSSPDRLCPVRLDLPRRDRHVRARLLRHQAAGQGALLPEAVVSAYVVMLCFIGAFAARNNLTDLWWWPSSASSATCSRSSGSPSRRWCSACILGPLAESTFMTTMISFGRTTGRCSSSARSAAR
jgi:putative tricarboxylic transport membrane protein